MSGHGGAMNPRGEVWPHPVDAAALVRRLRPRHIRAVILLDGPSGSGKTTLAAELATVWGEELQVVHLDDIYPGWQGLAEASTAVWRDVLNPEPGFRRWDWVADRPAEWVPLDPTLPILVEGCGALTAAAARLATGTVWCELDDETRKRRALARDGAEFARHWDEWAAQEELHWAQHSPRLLADLLVLGRPDAPGAQAPRC